MSGYDPAGVPAAPRAESTGLDPAVSDRAGDQSTGDHSTGDDVTRDHSTGDDVTRDHLAGDHLTGDHPTGSDSSVLDSGGSDRGGSDSGGSGSGGLDSGGSDPTADPADLDKRQLLLDSIGGWRGVLDSTLPVVVFIVANTLGGLEVAVWTAIGVGLALVALRLIRRQSVQQAFSGFFGLAIAALIARQTGEAKGFFLLGIWGSLIYACLFTASALVRRPVVGLIWEWVSPSGLPWRQTRPLLRVYTAATLLFAAIFLARFLVQERLYDADETGWLAAARLAMGYPLTILALGATVLAVRRARNQLEAAPAT